MVSNYNTSFDENKIYKPMGSPVKIRDGEKRTYNNILSGVFMGCGGHFFDENMMCRCGTSWEEHQSKRTMCETRELFYSPDHKGKDNEHFLEGCIYIEEKIIDRPSTKKKRSNRKKKDAC